MTRRLLLVLCCVMVLVGLVLTAGEASAQQAYGRQWNAAYHTQDWNRLYHYPYVWYPQNFWGEDYYRSNGNMYHRYPAEMRIPVYNRQWHNYYPETVLKHGRRRVCPPEKRRYHSGHHFQLDVF
jgi:hypothetical protein